MSGDIVLGIRLKYDGKEVAGGVTVSREQFRALANEAKKAGEATAGGFTTAARGVRSISEQLAQAKNAAIGFLGVQGIGGIVRLADEFSTLQSRLRLVSAGTADLAANMAQVFRIANDTRTDAAALGDTYARMARATKEAGVSSQALMVVTRAIGQAMTISGGSAESMRAALVQLGQGLASNRLSGDELRSVLEQAPRLAQAIADGMGVSVGRLRQLGEQGALTARQIIDAIENAAPRLEAEFARMTPTIGQAGTVLKNAMLEAIGELDGAAGASKSLANGIVGIARGLREATPELKKFIEEAGPLIEIAKVLAVFAGGRMLAGLAARALPGVAAAGAAIGVGGAPVAGAVGLGAAAAYATNRLLESEWALRTRIAAIVKEQAERGQGWRARELAELREIQAAKLAAASAAKNTGYDAKEERRAASIDAANNPPLPNMQAIGEVAKDLKTRSNILRAYWDEVTKIETTAAAEIVKARNAAERAALEGQMKEALAAADARRQQELEGLPQAKEAKAQAEALADARVRAAQAASKRVIETLKQEHDQYRISSEALIRGSTEAKVKAIGAQLEALRGKLDAPGLKESERIPIREKIKELVADLAALPGESQAAFAEVETQRRKLLADLAADAARLDDPLARAGLEFGKKWGEAVPRAIADGADDMLEAARRDWDTMATKATFDAARTRFDAVAKSAEASLEGIRVSAAAGTLPAVDALLGTEAVRRRAAADLEAIQRELAAIAARSTDPATHAALAETAKKLQEAKLAAVEATTGWQAGARAAFQDYERNAADTAGNTRRAFTDGYRRMEDAVVQFARTGKLSLRDLADYAISEFYRMQVAQPFVRALGGAFDGWMNGGASAGPSTAAGGGTWVPSYNPAALSTGTAAAGLSAVPGRASGGPVASGGFYRVNENEPEMLSIDGRDYLMMGRRSGYVTPPGRGAGSGGASAPVTLVYSPVFHIDARGAGIGAGQIVETSVRRAVAETKGDILQNMNAGGAFAVASGRRPA